MKRETVEPHRKSFIDTAPFSMPHVSRCSSWPPCTPAGNSLPFRAPPHVAEQGVHTESSTQRQ